MLVPLPGRTAPSAPGSSAPSDAGRGRWPRAPCQKESPKRIGKRRARTVAKVLAPPKTDPEQVERAGGAVRVGDRLDAVRLDLGDRRRRCVACARWRSARWLMTRPSRSRGEGMADRCSWTTRTTLVVAAGQDDGLPLVEPLLALGGAEGRPHPVGDDGGGAQQLHLPVAALAPHHAPAAGHPGVPQGAVRRTSRDDLRLAVEQERRLGRQAGEVRRRVGAGEGLDEGVERREGVGLVERWQGAVRHAGVSSVGGVDARGPWAGRAIDLTSRSRA